MFDIGWSELLVIGVVALIAIGPKELPGVLRSMGHWMGKVRRMASEFQDQFREAMREAEVADLKKQFDDASASATSVFNNPLETAQKEVEAAFADTDPTKAPTSVETKITTSDPDAIEPSPAAPAIVEADVAQASAAPADAPVVPAQPAETRPTETKPGGSV